MKSLPSAEDFARVLARGSRKRVGKIEVAIAAGAGPARVGLVVRGTRSAVARNRIKRRMRAALASARLRSGMDYVVLVSEETMRADFETIQRWLDECVN